MSRRNPWGEFFQNFDSAYNLGNKVGLQIGLRRAADVKPEAVTNTSLTDTTPNQEGMVYDADTGQYLPKYIGADGAPTEQAQAQLNTPTDGESEAPVGMQPTFAPRTTTSYKMGGKVQEQPFTPEQIDAQRFRNQADVYTRYGMDGKAAGLHALAKGREEEGRTNAVRQSFIEGMAKNANLKPLERIFRAATVAADTALEQGNISEWDKRTKMNEGIQSKLLNNHLDRADMIADPKSRLVAYADAYKYILDGRTTAGVTHNTDGTSTIKLSDGHEITAKSEDDIAKIGLFLRDPSMVRKLQQDAAIKARDRQTSREDKAWEWSNKPIELNKGSRLVIPGKEGTGSAGPRGPIDPLEHQSMLDDIRNYALMNFGEKDPVTGKPVAQNEKSRQVAADMESLYATGGHALPPTTLLSIATNGKRSSHSVLINGQPKRVEGFAYNGVLYPVEPGIGPVPMKSPADAASADVPASVKRRFSGLGSPSEFSDTRRSMGAGAPQARTTGIGSNNVSGQISGGMQKAGAVSYNSPELDQIAVSAAQESGIPPKLLLAIKNAGEKSNNDQVSKKGAAGVMQFMPDTAKAYGVDSTNPASAIKGAGRYLADLIKQYRGNVAAAVAHYNGGSTQGALVASGKPPTYPETRAYLERVLAASEAPA